MIYEKGNFLHKKRATESVALFFKNFVDQVSIPPST